MPGSGLCPAQYEVQGFALYPMWYRGEKGKVIE